MVLYLGHISLNISPNRLWISHSFMHVDVFVIDQTLKGPIVSPKCL